MSIRTFIVAVVICLPGLLLGACSEPYQPEPLKSLPGQPRAFEAAGFTPQPLPYRQAIHPFMAAPGLNSMHADAASTDVHPGPAPLGSNTRVVSRSGNAGGRSGGQCATLTFSSDGKLIVLCARLTGFRLNLLTPRSLELLAEYALPMRSSTYEAVLHRDKSKVMEDSSGAYFYLDNQQRVVIADSHHHVRRVGFRQRSSGEWEFYLEQSWDLSAYIPSDCLRLSNPFPNGECDPITAVMPDYQGLIWWVTRAGRLGTLNPETGRVQSSRFENEEIQNGFSVAADGVYIVSDHALYRLQADADGKPQLRWREAYDRGSSRKVGTINQGSGTTPTLFGDYVTIADNADTRINLLVYRRYAPADSERLICKVPLFAADKSVTDNSMIAYGRSIILENNAGFSSVYGDNDWNAIAGGISRIDVRDDASGCDVIWESEERSPSTVPKLSAAVGIAYFYTFEPLGSGINAWFLTGLDFKTGKTLFKIHTGNGPAFNNNWAPISLAPDGTAYIGTARGIVAVWDEN